MSDKIDVNIVLVLVKCPKGYILQHRDEKPGEITAPGAVSLFGGWIDSTDESIKHAALRELNEETDLNAVIDDLKKIGEISYEGEVHNGKRKEIHASYFLYETDRDEIEVHEGQGFVLMPFDAKLTSYKIAPGAGFFLSEYLEKKKDL